MAVGSLIGLTLIIAYVPYFEFANFRSPWPGVGFALTGGFVTSVAWRNGCTGRWGSWATLFDNSFYCASLSWLACHSTEAVGLFFSACLATMLLAFQGPHYGFSLPMAAAISGPPLVIGVWSRPLPLVALALGGSCLLCALRMSVTRAIVNPSQRGKTARRAVQGASGARYELEGQVGAGGMGAVYRATSEAGTTVAVKILHRGVHEQARQRQRLLREAIIINGIRHEGIVHVLDCGVDEQGSAFIVMELLTGRTLAQEIEHAGGRLPWRKAVDVMVEVLDVLTVAHERGVVHCDIKPSNIFICQDERVKLLDFGIARESEQLLDLTVSMNVAGTPSCMAPEQVLNIAGIDERTDVWGVGATLFRTISGAWPREFPEPCHSLASAMRIRARPLESFAPHVPRALSLAIDVALSLDPSARWSSARSLKQQLLSLTREPRAGAVAASLSAAEERVQA